MSGPAPGWYPDAEQAQTQRYWDGEEWTEHRAPAAKQKPQPAWLAPVIVAVVGVALLLYFTGRLDNMLYQVGLNFKPCAEFALTGNVVCGSELEQTCEQPFFSRANEDVCAEVRVPALTAGGLCRDRVRVDVKTPPDPKTERRWSSLEEDGVMWLTPPI